MLLIEFDETKLTEFDLSFLQEWAGNLGVSLEVLLSRILAHAARGSFYLTNNPAQDRPESETCPISA